MDIKILERISKGFPDSRATPDIEGKGKMFVGKSLQVLWNIPMENLQQSKFPKILVELMKNFLSYAGGKNRKNLTTLI